MNKLTSQDITQPYTSWYMRNVGDDGLIRWISTSSMSWVFMQQHQCHMTQLFEIK